MTLAQAMMLTIPFLVIITTISIYFGEIGATSRQSMLSIMALHIAAIIMCGIFVLNIITLGLMDTIEAGDPIYLMMATGSSFMSWPSVAINIIMLKMRKERLHLFPKPRGYKPNSIL